tara:strand:+ start:13279 stop:14370 length:1092 start_codon:yes stop_codon:yes gene_type:complete
MMKIGADACLMASHPRGMGQYARALVEPVASNCLGFLPRNMKMTQLRYANKGTSIFPIWEQFFLPSMAKSHAVTHLLSPSNTSPLFGLRGIFKILVIHDLIFMKNFKELERSSSHYQNIGRLYRRVVVPRAAKNADVLVTVSDFSKQDIIRRFGISDKKIHVIPNSISDSWLRPKSDIFSLRDRQPYFLAVSGEAPSKNLVRLLEAFSCVIHSSFEPKVELRVVGVGEAAREALWRHVLRLKISGSVHFEDFLSEPQLMELYRKAYGFVFPSLYEGFGIPLLESMASGTPIICSNTTAIPEVVGDAALFFDPRNPADMANQMLELLSDKGRWLDLSRKGINQVEKFSKERIRKKIVEFWGELA